MPRKAIYTPETRVFLLTRPKPDSKLQGNSERRAIVNKVVDFGGEVTIKDLETHFGYDLKQQIGSLVRSGWLRAG